MSPAHSSSSPACIHRRAADELRFIRQTLERSATFAAVPGVGGMAMGALAVTAALLNIGLWQPEAWHLLPALWLLLYGTAVLAGGAFSLASVRTVGLAFIALGVVALFGPSEWGYVWLGLGFGGLHLVAGLHIAQAHGG